MTVLRPCVSALVLLLTPLAAQEHTSEAVERAFFQKGKTPTDVRFGLSFGMAQATNADTKEDLASSGRGADLSMALDFPLHNHLVLGARLGGIWFRERSQPFTPLPTYTVTQQTKGFYLGFEGKYFITDANALRGPYVTAAAQWTRWKKYLGLDYQGNNYGDGESMDKTAFTPVVGLGWQFNRVVGVDVRFTRSRFREEYDYFAGYSKDWNLDHVTVALVLRGGGKHLVD
ncbi:MAG TPA: hypothetical protein VJ623_06715 [Holophagaceae bacterium]|nr:hypothetical protein [Holophagaceae bacterium]